MRSKYLGFRLFGFIASLLLLGFASVISPLKLAHNIGLDKPDDTHILKTVKPMDATVYKNSKKIKSKFLNKRRSLATMLLNPNDLKLQVKGLLLIEKTSIRQDANPIIKTEKDSTNLKKGLPVAPESMMQIESHFEQKQALEPHLVFAPQAEFESKQLQFKLYPNPASEYIKIDLNDKCLSKEIVYRIFDMKGYLIARGIIVDNITEINTSTYPNGFYFINLQSEKLNLKSTEKIAIRR